MTVLGDKVYIGGHFLSVGGSYGQTEGRVPRDAFAAVDAATGQLSSEWVSTQVRNTKADGQVWVLKTRRHTLEDLRGRWIYQHLGTPAVKVRTVLWIGCSRLRRPGLSLGSVRSR